MKLLTGRLSDLSLALIMSYGTPPGVGVIIPRTGVRGIHFTGTIITGIIKGGLLIITAITATGIIPAIRDTMTIITGTTVPVPPR